MQSRSKLKQKNKTHRQINQQSFRNASFGKKKKERPRKIQINRIREETERRVVICDEMREYNTAQKLMETKKQDPKIDIQTNRVVEAWVSEKRRQVSPELDQPNPKRSREKRSHMEWNASQRSAETRRNENSKLNSISLTPKGRKS